MDISFARDLQLVTDNIAMIVDHQYSFSFWIVSIKCYNFIHYLSNSMSNYYWTWRIIICPHFLVASYATPSWKFKNKKSWNQQCPFGLGWWNIKRNIEMHIIWILVPSNKKWLYLNNLQGSLWSFGRSIFSITLLNSMMSMEYTPPLNLQGTTYKKCTKL